MDNYLRTAFLSVLFLTTYAFDLSAQTRILPVGNSITWGKENNQHPQGDHEGYRKILRESLVNDGFNIQFVGDSGSVENRGYYADKSKIGWYIHADSTKGDMTNVLNTYTPDLVILHIGTNDVGSGRPIGDYATAGTIMNQLYTLVTKITNHAGVDNLLLCKIIPKLITPGEAAQTASYNNAIEILLTELTPAQRAKVELVDMYTPFYANQTTYYNLDVDPVHPNMTGYNRMAEILFQYIRRIFVPSFTDPFDRAAGAVIGPNWVSHAGMQLVDNGENGGGALTFREPGGDLQWDNMAVWQDSKNLTTVSVTFTDNTNDVQQSNLEGLTSVGVAVALDAAATNANGYLLFYFNGKLRVFTVVGGSASAGQEVASQTMNALQPGDNVKVGYRKAADANYFAITITSGGQETSFTMSDPNRRAGNGDDLYSGVLFKGYVASPYEYYVDEFQVETQLDDNTAPDAPYSLTGGLVTKTTVALSWTAPGNDGSVGTASAYDLRYSNSPIADLDIDPTDFANATIVTGVPQPAVSGTPQSYTIAGLVPGSRFYIRMQAVDSWGNKSLLSTQVIVRTSDAGFTIESFDRQAEPDGSIGPDWNIDTNEYSLDYNAGTGDGQFVNTQGSGGWGRVAVYTGRRNPSIVKMVWGENATKDGIGQGGLALMLDNSSVTQANGYLLWIRDTGWRNMIFLWNIRSGRVDGAEPIAETAYTLRDQSNNLRFPQHGDTMTVIMDWFDPEGIKFNVQINGQPASDAPLYDPDKLHNSNVKYAGLMLGRVYGTQNNNVTAFYVSSELTGVGGLEVVPYPNTATVATTMNDSLKILVRDINNNPLPDTPVWFWATEPADASITAPDPMNDPILIEAEWDLEPKGTYSVLNDKPSASGGKYVNATTGGAEAGELNYEFYVDQAGDYWLWGRTISRGNGHYAVKIVVDEKVAWTYQWNTTYPSYSSLFAWSRIRHINNNPSAITLTQGVHTLKVLKLHDDVPIDKFFITSNGNYVPSGNEYRDILMTGSDGTAGTVLTLGEKTGVNKVKARAFGSGETADFNVTGLADTPMTMEVANQNQSGPARTLLARPFQLTLKDQYGNFTPGIVVAFELIQGDGTLTAVLDTTDANGQASTYLQLGYAPQPNQVRATIPGTGLDEVIFTGTALSGLPKAIESLVNLGGVKHFINQKFPNLLRIKVLDDQNQPMPDVPVFFEVVKGSATIGTKTPNLTDAGGIFADTLKLGARAGQVIVVARAGGLEDTVLVDSVYNHATSIVRSGPEIVTADVEDQISRRTVKVRVWNQYPIEPAVNHPVLFVAKGNGFKFPNGNDTLVVNSDNDGYAETLVVPGLIHGQYVDVIEVQATDGFLPIQGSPVKFTIHNESDASRLLMVQGDSLIGVVLEALETPLQVKMVRDPDGAPMANQPVLFKIESGAGSFVETEFPEYSDFTNADGIAEVYYRLGPKTGTPDNPFNNVVSATATNGIVPLDGSPVTFHISAQSSAATAMAADSDTAFVGVVGKPLGQKVRVKVMDDLGNGVSGEEVHFSVLSGGGTLGNGPDSTASVLIENAGGIAVIDWVLGPGVGANGNVLQARASNGTSELAGSPLLFYASGMPDVVSGAKSTIVAEGPRQATGIDTSRIVVTLFDKFGNPVAGKRVTLKVVGGDRNHIHNPMNPTDAQGQAIGYLLSYSAGIKTVSATVTDDQILLSETAEVIFTANDAAEMRKHTTGALVGNAGTVLKDSLAVLITDDNKNPVAYGPVKFSVKNGGGRIIGDETVISDSNGVAYTWFILGPNPGNNVVEASAQALDASPLLGSPVTYNITGELGEPVSMFAASEQVFTGLAGEILEQPFKIGVIDEDGDPVGQVDITYEVQQGGGGMATGQPVKTDAWGEAVAFFRADEEVGVINQILAKANLAGGPILFEVTSRAGSAYRIVRRSGHGQSGTVNGSLGISVNVTDKYNNAVGGVAVTFEIESGDANFGGENSIIRNSSSSGIASATVTLGDESGVVKVKARARLLEGSPVQFTLYNLAAGPATLVRYPAGTEDVIASKGQLLPAPLYVQVGDEFGNPVPGRFVVWSEASGDAQLVGIPESETGVSVMTDSNGIAAARFKAGTGGGSTVKALMLDKEVVFTIQQVSNPNFPELDMSLTANQYEKFEGELLNIPLRAFPDGDGDPLTFVLGNLFPPDGVVMKKQSATTAVLQWTPTFDQQGEYAFAIRVQDNRGGFDADTIDVTIYDTNREPEIVETIPAGSDTGFTAGQVVTFWVGAIDPDGDGLHYTWRVDGVIQGQDAPLFHLDVDKYFRGNQLLEVSVSDGKEVVKHRWNLDVTTTVQLSQMIANFDLWQNTVFINWATSRETDNKGFDVYKSTVKDGSYKKLTEDLIPSAQDGKYLFGDAAVKVGATYYYKLVDVDTRGNENENGPISIQIPKPEKFLLTQNYPNPFNPTTKIRYHVPRDEHVSVTIYNMMGQVVNTLVDKSHEPGYYLIEWNGRNLWGNEVSTGLYIYRLQSDTKVLTKRMVKLK